MAIGVGALLLFMFGGSRKSSAAMKPKDEGEGDDGEGEGDRGLTETVPESDLAVLPRGVLYGADRAEAVDAVALQPGDSVREVAVTFAPGDLRAPVLARLSSAAATAPVVVRLGTNAYMEPGEVYLVGHELTVTPDGSIAEEWTGAETVRWPDFGAAFDAVAGDVATY